MRIERVFTRTRRARFVSDAFLEGEEIAIVTVAVLDPFPFFPFISFHPFVFFVPPDCFALGADPSLTPKKNLVVVAARLSIIRYRQSDACDVEQSS